MSVTISTMDQEFTNVPCQGCEDDMYVCPPGCTGVEPAPIYPELNLSNSNFCWVWSSLGMEVSQDLCGSMEVNSPEWNSLFATVLLNSAIQPRDTYAGSVIYRILTIMESVRKHNHQGISWG